MRHQQDDTPRAGKAQIRLALVLVAVLGIGAAVLALVNLRAEPPTAQSPALTQEPITPAKTFPQWPRGQKPDLAIVLTGQTLGYLQPCGCSRPQLGGLERRYNLIQTMRSWGWKVLPLDVGDVSATMKAGKPRLHKQLLLKHTATMKAMAAMGYAALGLGRVDFALPLADGLANFTLQRGDEPPFVLAANLAERATKFPGADGPMVGSVKVFGDADTPKVGVVGVVGAAVGEAVEKRIDKRLAFADNRRVLQESLAALEKHGKLDLRVLLYHGDFGEAKRAAEAFPQFDLILCRSAESTPPRDPVRVGKTKIIRVGQKGRQVGAVGVFGGELKYQLIELGEDFETADAAQADHPVLKVFQEYADQLEEEDFLSEYPKASHPTQTKFAGMQLSYVGSAKCKSCHAAEYAAWEKSKHSHAYKALSEVATKPTRRNFDGECIVCHTVGFAYKTGYVNRKTTPHLKNVGCESCHGPGSLHAAMPKIEKFYLAMSPWKRPGHKEDRLPPAADMAAGKPMTEAQRYVFNKVDAVCQKCHDVDNDPHFRLESKKYWPQIVHTGLGKK